MRHINLFGLNLLTLIVRLELVPVFHALHVPEPEEYQVLDSQNADRFPLGLPSRATSARP
jgi:hypothetical protein